MVERISFFLRSLSCIRKGLVRRKLRLFPFRSSLIVPNSLWKTNTPDYLDMGRKYKSIAEKARKVSPGNRLEEKEVRTWFQNCCTILVLKCTESSG